MERVIVVRHHDIDSAGFIADAFEARGAELGVHLFPHDGPLPAFDGAGHIVVLGAVSSVNDPDPWIAAELDWLRGADRAGAPKQIPSTGTPAWSAPRSQSSSAAIQGSGSLTELMAPSTTTWSTPASAGSGPSSGNR